MSKKTIYLEDAINALHNEIVKRRISEDVNDDGALDEFDTESILRRLQPAQPDNRDVMHIIFETLSECGIYGEEATIKVVGTLKRLGMDDLLPPCAR